MGGGGKMAGAGVNKSGSVLNYCRILAVGIPSQRRRIKSRTDGGLNWIGSENASTPAASPSAPLQFLHLKSDQDRS